MVAKTQKVLGDMVFLVNDAHFPFGANMGS